MILVVRPWELSTGNMQTCARSYQIIVTPWGKRTFDTIWLLAFYCIVSQLFFTKIENLSSKGLTVSPDWSPNFPGPYQEGLPSSCTAQVKSRLTKTFPDNNCHITFTWNSIWNTLLSPFSRRKLLVAFWVDPKHSIATMQLPWYSELFPFKNNLGPLQSKFLKLRRPYQQIQLC